MKQTHKPVKPFNESKHATVWIFVPLFFVLKELLGLKLEISVPATQLCIPGTIHHILIPTSPSIPTHRHWQPTSNASSCNVSEEVEGVKDLGDICLL